MATNKKGAKATEKKAGAKSAGNKKVPGKASRSRNKPDSEEPKQAWESGIGITCEADSSNQ